MILKVILISTFNDLKKNSLNQLRISAYSLTRSKCGVWIVLEGKHDLSRFIFIMRPKNPEAHESELDQKNQFHESLKLTS